MVFLFCSFFLGNTPGVEVFRALRGETNLHSAESAEVPKKNGSNSNGTKVM